MKPNYELDIKGFDNRIEMRLHGSMSMWEKLTMLDQITKHLDLDDFGRFAVGYTIMEGGIAKIMGKDYGTTIKFDGEALMKMMEKFKEEGTEQ